MTFTAIYLPLHSNIQHSGIPPYPHYCTPFTCSVDTLRTFDMPFHYSAVVFRTHLTVTVPLSPVTFSNLPARHTGLFLRSYATPSPAFAHCVLPAVRLCIGVTPSPDTAPPRITAYLRRFGRRHAVTNKTRG